MFILLKFALKSPERVDRIVLVSSFCLGREISFFERYLGAFLAIAFLAKPSRQTAKMLLSSCVYNLKSLPPEWIDLSYQLFKLPDKKQAVISLIKNNIDLWGVKDEVFKPIVDRLESIAANGISNNSSHIFDKCGYWAQVEYP